MRREIDLIAFVDHLAVFGGHVEVGTVWSLERGWHCFVRAGSQILHLPGWDARALANLLLALPQPMEAELRVASSLLASAKMAATLQRVPVQQQPN